MAVTGSGSRPSCGPYEILALLGKGGGGEVYRAWDPRLQREVALKILRGRHESDPRRVHRFAAEARAAGALNHPNIVAVFDAAVDGETPYIVSELIDGEPLREHIRRGPLPLARLLDLATQIADGLAAAHDAHIVHRDLKPENIVVTRTGRAKIVDFGLARTGGFQGSGAAPPPVSSVEQTLTESGLLAGTVPYMSPEQARGAEVDFRSDQFAFGLILYEMATGHHPFRRATPAATLDAIINDELTPIARPPARLPVQLRWIVERCLAKEPGDRYAATSDLYRDLRRLRDRAAESLLQEPAPAVPPIRWPRRRSLAAAGAGLVVVVAVVVAFRYASRPDDPVPREIRLEAVPFTSYIGREAEPTFSPDGSQVAFTWDGENQDNFDIYVKVIGAEQPLQLTSDPARDGSPAWSPDGTVIAFLRDKPGGGSEVFLIPPTGGSERPIGEVQGQAHEGLSWASDGRSLAVVDRSSPGDFVGIFVLDTETGVKRRLTPPAHAAIQPTFSPDGLTIAFNQTLLPRGPFVHVVPVNGGEPRELAPTSFPRGRLAWMQGGAQILFAAAPAARDGGQPRPSAHGSARSLWRVPAAGGEASLLAGSENAVDVALSADGRRLVYSQGTMDWDIWRLDLRRGPATEEAQTRFIASTKADANPQFSPDGERVAFTSGRSGRNEIWVVDGQGRHPRRLTYLEGFAAAPRWSPDGKTIAFDFAPKGGNNVDIYVISAQGGAAHRVTTSPAIDAMPSWSRDGHWIYFASNRSGRWQVWKVPSSGEDAGNARQVTRGGGFAAIESSDGHLYFTPGMAATLNPQSAIWRLPVEGGDAEVVVEGYRSSHASWDLTAEGLYFVDQEPSSSGTSWVVRFQGFDRRQATVVARLRYPPFLGGPAVSVSFDGRWMLSTQGYEESDLMLAEIFR